MPKVLPIVAVLILSSAVDSVALLNAFSAGIGGNIIQDFEITLCEMMGNVLGNMPGHSNGCGDRYSYRSVSEMKHELQVVRQELEELRSEFAITQADKRILEQKYSWLNQLVVLNAERSSSDQDHAAQTYLENVFVDFVFHFHYIIMAVMVLVISSLYFWRKSVVLEKLLLESRGKTDACSHVEQGCGLDSSVRSDVKEQSSQQCATSRAETADLAMASDDSDDESWSCVQAASSVQSEDDGDQLAPNASSKAQSEDEGESVTFNAN
jgi:hypothetical protein